MRGRDDGGDIDVADRQATVRQRRPDVVGRLRRADKPGRAVQEYPGGPGRLGRLGGCIDDRPDITNAEHPYDGAAHGHEPGGDLDDGPCPAVRDDQAGSAHRAHIPGGRRPDDPVDPSARPPGRMNDLHRATGLTQD